MRDHPTAKKGVSSTGEPMHYSAGTVIKRNGKYLLVDRALPPFGFAGLAGHVDEGETPEEAIRREVKEEGNLTVISCKKIVEEEIQGNRCSKDIPVHYWYLFSCEVSPGEAIYHQREAKTIGWYTPEDIKKLRLEPVWEYWFKKLNII
jgi:ADP-ribose pyrophosphatase YjhB (NUDIX family)